MMRRVIGCECLKYPLNARKQSRVHDFLGNMAGTESLLNQRSTVEGCQKSKIYTATTLSNFIIKNTHKKILSTLTHTHTHTHIYMYV
jgi:hypothetical protein